MGAAHPDVVRAKLQWAVALAQRGDATRALEIADVIAIPPGDRRIEADAAFLRGRVRLIAGQLAKACPDLDRGWRLRSELDGAEDPATLECELYLGECLLLSGVETGRLHIRHAARALLDSPITTPVLRADALRSLKRTSALLSSP